MTINTEYCNVREHTLYRMHFDANSYHSLKHLVTLISVTLLSRFRQSNTGLYYSPGDGGKEVGLPYKTDEGTRRRLGVKTCF